jgi:hypothetical protein
VCRTTVGIFKSYCNKNFFFNLHIINMHLALFTQRRGSNQIKMFPTKFENFRSSFILFGSFVGQILKYFRLCLYSILIISNNFQVFVMFRWWHSSFKCIISYFACRNSRVRICWQNVNDSNAIALLVILCGLLATSWTTLASCGRT